MTNHLIALFALSLAAGCGSFGGQSESRGSGPGEIIAKSRAAYRGCRSYTDEMSFQHDGVFLTALTPKSGKVSMIFAEPNYLRADVQIDGEKDVLWYVDGIANAYLGSLNVFTIRPIHQVLNMFSRNTAGLTLSVPTLLLRQSDLPIPDFYEEAKIADRLPDEVISGVKCYVISGVKELALPVMTDMELATKVWVCSTDYLIRKIATTLRQKGTVVEETVVLFKPKIGMPIDRKRFKFHPPATAEKRD